MTTPFTEDDIPALLEQMTLEEKASLCSGGDAWHTQAIERLGIPEIMMTDGPHGLRKAKSDASLGDENGTVPATCFPTASALGSTWNPALLHEVGAAIAKECRIEDVAILLGPGINMKRSPLCGRNFEYFSEDPRLTGELAAEMVRGVQSEGVGTSLKHFAVNNQETDRLRVSSDVDERAIREIYLPAFEKVVTAADPWTSEKGVTDAEPWTIMYSYNKINGVFSSENPWLLTDILRKEWGYEGLVVSDWGAVNNRVAGVQAGMDLEMPGGVGINDARIVQAVRDGELAEEALDRIAGRVLRLIARALAAAETASPLPSREEVHADNHALARRIAASSAVLLKNDEVDGVPVLPLPGGDGVVVIGEFARTPRYQGAGSSKVNPTRVDNALDALQEIYGDLPFAPGYEVPQRLEDRIDPDQAARLRDEAVDCARGAHTALLFLGLPAVWESEGYDRTTLEIPAEHVELLAAVREVAQRVVVVLSNGGVVTTDNWEKNADAILECWLGGQAGGGAMADLLSGAVAPQGRLAESIPLRLSDVPAQVTFPGERGHSVYGESIFIGYRGLDRAERDVSYPFGHGLTYTTFAYTDLQVTIEPITAETEWDDYVLMANVEVTNTGARSGVAIPQFYVSRPQSEVLRAPKELLEYVPMVELAPGETEKVTIVATRRDLAHWDLGVNGWAVESGPLVVSVGSSSRDLAESVQVNLIAPPIVAPLGLDSTVGEWMAIEEVAEAMSAGAKKIGASADMQEDPAFASYLLSIPIRRLASTIPFITQEEVDRLIAPHIGSIPGQ